MHTQRRLRRVRHLRLTRRRWMPRRPAFLACAVRRLFHPLVLRWLRREGRSLNRVLLQRNIRTSVSTHLTRHTTHQVHNVWPQAVPASPQPWIAAAVVGTAAAPLPGATARPRIHYMHIAPAGMTSRQMAPGADTSGHAESGFLARRPVIALRLAMAGPATSWPVLRRRTAGIAASNDTIVLSLIHI